MTIRMGIAAVLAAGVFFTPAALPSGDNGEYERAQALFNAAEYAKAAAVLKGSDHDARRLELLGECDLLEGDYRGATEALEKAAALRPEDSKIATWLARAYGRRAETSFAMSALHFANKSRETFERAVDLDPTNRQALGDLFEFYVEAPSIVGGGVDKARALLPRFAHYDPVGHELSGALLAEHDGKYQEAESLFRQAIAMAPGDQNVYIDFAKFLARRGHYLESEATFDQARAVAPHSHRIDFERAETYIRLRRNRDKARALLKSYLAANDLTPNDPPKFEAIQLLKKAGGS